MYCEYIVQVFWTSPSHQARFGCLLLSLGLQGAIALEYRPTLAQVLPDQSLGAESSIANTAGPNQILITGGAQRDRLLFHSFQALNVGQGETLLFTPSAQVETILSRVTGGSASQILGNLGVLGNANLFLLNPKGILFGPQSQLSLAGSFIATTADRFTLGNQNFSAIDPSPPPLLTVNVPIGLGYGANPGTIVNQSIGTTGLGLTVAPFQTLALLGGDVILDGGRITTASGRIELGGFRNGSVNLRSNLSGFSIEANPETSLGSIRLQTGSSVTNALLAANPFQNPDALLQVTGDRLSLSTNSALQTANFSALPGIDLAVNTNYLDITTGAQLVSQTVGPGTSGQLRIKVSEDITIDGGSASDFLGLSRIGTIVDGPGEAAEIDLQAGSLILNNGGAVISVTYGTGNAGPIQINLREDFIASSPAVNFPIIRSGINMISLGPGGGSDIRINSKNILIEAGGVIESFITGDGRVGNIIINVEEQTIIRGENPLLSELESKISVPTFGRSDGGDLILNTKDLLIDQGGGIFTASAKLSNGFQILYGDKGQFIPSEKVGNVGNVKINADTITIQGIGNARENANLSLIASFTLLDSQGGDVDIKTRQLNIRDGGVLVASSIITIPEQIIERSPQSGQGQGGNLTVRAEDIRLEGKPAGGRFVNSILGTQTLGLGNAGNTTIDTNTLSLFQGASVSSGTVNAGNAGNLTINARDRILVQGKNLENESSAIGSFAIAALPATRETFNLPDQPTGNTGNLVINTGNLTLRDGGLIGVQHTGQGNAGTLAINAKTIVAVPQENSDIIANAIQGKGGSITINAAGLFGIGFSNRLTDRSEISSNSRFNLDGTVQIDRSLVDPGQGLTELPTLPLEPAAQIVTDCDRLGDSRFVVSGRSGLQNDPRNRLQSTSPLLDWREGPDIIATEANQLRYNSQGEIELLAQQPSLSNYCVRRKG